MTLQCPTGKQPHRTERSAAVAVRLIREKGGQGTHAYHCDRCHEWHVGTTRVRVAQPAKASAFARPSRQVADDVPGTTYCQREGCGHPTNLHAGGICLGKRGKCTCSEVAS